MTRLASAIPFFSSFLFPFIAVVALTSETNYGLILAWTLPLSPSYCSQSGSNRTNGRVSIHKR